MMASVTFTSYSGILECSHRATRLLGAHLHATAAARRNRNLGATPVVPYLVKHTGRVLAALRLEVLVVLPLPLAEGRIVLALGLGLVYLPKPDLRSLIP